MNSATFVRKSNLLKKRLEKIQSSVFSTEASSKVSPLSDIQIRRLSCWKNELDTTMSEFSDLVNRFTDIETSLERDDELVVKLREEMSDTHIEATCVLSALLSKANDKSPNPNGTIGENSQPRSSVRLPKLELPQFSGEPMKWMPYYNAFEMTIHKNSTLTQVDKFQYLLSSLRGEALQIISGLPITGDNYAIAWNLLHKRYHNVRKLISLHVSKIMDMPSVINGSLSSIRSFLSTYFENTQALAALQYDITQENILLLTILVRKLNFETRKRFEDTRGVRHDLPAVSDLIKFLEAECIHLEDAMIDGRSKGTVKIAQNKSNKISLITTTNHCAFCRDPNHVIYLCSAFKDKSPQERHAIVKEKKWCYNCLGTSHSVNSCKSSRRCRSCDKKHHSLLHLDLNSNSSQNNSHDAATVSENMTSLLTSVNLPPKLIAEKHFVGISSAQLNTSILLATALIRLTTPSGLSHVVRGILDSAAQCSFITERCAQALNVTRRRITSNINGVSLSQVKSHGITCLSLSSLDGKVLAHSHPMVILKNITSNLPLATISPEVKEKAKSFVLADPTFDVPSPIDVLIGADLFPHVFTGPRCFLGDGYPVAFDTIFGFVLMGTTTIISPADSNNKQSFALISTHEADLHASIHQFWQLEEVPHLSLSPQDQLCEDHFRSTHTRDQTGRYVTRLPFKDHHPPLGDSSIAAKRRLFAMERRLSAQPLLREKYCKFMSDYLDLGHMELCGQLPVSPHYFLPHHGVLKNQDPSSSLRVVFDASSKSSSNVSLNDILLSGPKLQNDICDVILRFRCHSVVFACDIQQMYRQIKIHPDDQHYQLVYWRENPTHPLTVYKLTTVTYGVTSSPFLAIRTLHQLAEDEGANFPRAARVLTSQTFVDDIIAGADDVQEALALQKELTQLLSLGGFQLRKWCSNSDLLLSHIPEDDREIPLSFQHSEQPIFNILGMHWNSASDHFSYIVNISDEPSSKRAVLSAVARIYDPCGWLAPVVFLAKSFMQYLWTLGLQWDDPLPQDSALRWKEILKHLSRVKEITLPRTLFLTKSTTVQLHAFCDASELGYAAVIYLRCASLGVNPKITILIAKSRVAPLKRVSLPRLELCGAYLLAKLVHYSSNLVSNYCQIESVTAWCDSTITLSWIRTPPYRLKVFVANRVAQIQEWIPPERWFHVSSQHNPADCASRGQPTQLFDKNSTWWFGPQWLSLPSEAWPKSSFTPLDQNLPEVKQPIFNVCTSTPSPEWDLLLNFSSWSKLQRVVAYILRFSRNCRHLDNNYGMLSSGELQRAKHTICKLIQQNSFQEEFLLLQKGQPFTLRILRLSPFVDDEGLLRVGGRLKHAGLPYPGKHPILLPKSHRVVNLLIDYYHIKHLHAGPTLLMSVLREQFWIISARSVIRSRIFKCIRCFRCQPRNLPPLMGDLPRYRINQARPFQKTGMDYAGPFTIKSHALRRMVPLKAYLCLFICMCTKAVHLEVVTDLSSDAFIAALTRFISRRGLSTDLYSDCGTNFVGASTQLKITMKRFYSSPKVKNDILHFAAENNIKFHFIPPAAPHQGGLWERAIKSAKTLLIRSIGQTILTLQEFITLVVKVEAMLNSRPLTPLSADPADVSALTPGHFLIGTSLTALPEDDYAGLPNNRLSRWQMVQALSQRIWTRWHQEYLHTLQQRSKWTTTKENLKVGDLVVVHSPKAPPLLWCLARVTKTSPGDDGVVRVVQLHTPKGTLTRPVTQVFPLPIDD